MDLYYVKRSLLDEEIESDVCGESLEQAWGGTLREAAGRALKVIGATDRVPFVIRSDGHIDDSFSELFRLFAGQIQGRTSMESYGRHAFRFLSWLQRNGGRLESVTPKQLLEYKAARNAAGLKPISWNAEAAVLKSFFDVVVIAGIRNDNPCQNSRLSWYHQGASISPEEPDFITLEQFERFRDEGLAFGKFGVRNVAFSNMLLTSGMRLNEGASFPAAKLPTPAKVNQSKGKSVRYKVPASTAKGSFARTVRISKSAYQSMRSYDALLRDPMVEAGIAKGCYETEPDAFWLNQYNKPMGRMGWIDTFNRASTRSGIKATPKTLRHTCAVYLLSRLLKAMISSIADARAEAEKLKGRSSTQIFDSIFGDPLRRVQKYLGHAHYDTTFIYLDILGSHDQITDDALAVFDQVISAEEAFDVEF